MNFLILSKKDKKTWIVERLGISRKWKILFSPESQFGLTQKPGFRRAYQKFCLGV